MALSKVTYTDNVTTIYASNLNNIQDAIIALENGAAPTPYTSLPADLGVASAGSVSAFARGDHVHKMPSASDVGAIPAPASPSAGDVLTYSSGAWAAQALPTEVYWCTYGTTTSAQIEAAYQAGKLVMVVYNSIVYQLTYRGASTSHVFGAAKTQSATTVYTVSCASNVWSATSKNLIEAPSSPSSGQYLAWNGSAWVATSLPLYNGGVS